MSRIAIFGAGGMGRELGDILRASGEDFLFVVDDPDGPVDGVECVSPADLAAGDLLVIALGSSEDRRAVADRLGAADFATVIAPSARLSPSAIIGEGGLIADYAVINNGVRIGRHFQANCFAQVSHDCLIGDFVTLSPHVSCNGWVEIGDGVFVGAGAVIRNGEPGRRLRIGAGATIGMGAVVTSDVAAGARVVGNPARPF